MLTFSDSGATKRFSSGTDFFLKKYMKMVYCKKKGKGKYAIDNGKYKIARIPFQHSSVIILISEKSFYKKKTIVWIKHLKWSDPNASATAKPVSTEEKGNTICNK
jgi:hypothetical protein